MTSPAETARALLPCFDPSDAPLLEWLRSRIDDALLGEIAAADYGYNADANLLALRRVRDGDTDLAAMNWAPLEVLELIRWSEPDAPAWKPGETGARGHLMRAFCCAALLHAAADPAHRPYLHGENQTLIQLIASALHLGHVVVEAALRFVCWRTLALPAEEEERPFFAMGVLLLAAALRRAEADADLLRRLCAWVVAEEAHIRERQAGAQPLNPDAWLIGLSPYTLRDDVWRSVAWRVLVEPAEPHPAAAAAALESVGARLVLGYADGESA